MNFEYIYSLEDFKNNKVNEETLSYEIATSEITKALAYISVENEIECHIFFKAELSEDEQTLLDSIVADHEGEAIGQAIQVGFDRMQLLGVESSNIADVDAFGRFKVLASVIPKEHELSGAQHLGQLSDVQIPSNIVRDIDLTTLSGSLYQDIIDFADNCYTKTATDDLLNGKADLAHDHDLRYYKKFEIDDLLVTTHSGLSGLDSDDHLQYLTNERGDSRYYLRAEVDTISGSLTTAINTKADANHDHDEEYYTESEIDQFLGQKSDITHSHTHSELSNLTNDDHPQYLLVNGLRPIDGDLVVYGNLLVSGTQFISQTETVVINDNMFIINNGETGPGVSAGVAGIEVDRGTQENYRFMFNEHAQTFVVGVSGSERPVVVRATHGDLDSGYIPYFRLNTTDGLTFYELTTSGSLHKDNIASVEYVNSTASDLESEINTKSDIGHTHVEANITDLVHNAVQIQSKPVVEPTSEDDGKRLVYRLDSDSFELEESGYGGGGESFPFSYFYHINELDRTSTTNYKYWSTKLKLVVDVPEGKYRVGWGYQWSISSTSRYFEAMVVVDWRDLNSVSNFRYIDLEEGTHIILLKYKPSARATASIWNCELEFWKVDH